MITIVSGLPRSGTSLMMQMLAAGGMPLLTDAVRTADEHNPRGDFEDERVKTLESDHTWISEAEGKALKVVSLLLYELPREGEYRVLFMHRDLDEVLRSQQKMLTGETTRGATIKGDTTDLPSAALRTHFERHLTSLRDWLSLQPQMTVLDVEHRGVIEDPRAEAVRIAQFLQRELDIDRMASVVDPTLYRQRQV